MLKTMKPYWLLPFVLVAVIFSTSCKRNEPDLPFCKENEAADFKTPIEFKAALVGKWKEEGIYSINQSLSPTQAENTPSYKLSSTTNYTEYRVNDSSYYYGITSRDGEPVLRGVRKYNIGLTPAGKIGLYQDSYQKDFVTGDSILERTFLYLCSDGASLVLDFNYLKFPADPSHITFYRIFKRRY